MKRLIITTIILWSAFLLMHGYYFLLGKWGTLHPSCLPLILFVLVQVVAMLCAGVMSLWRIARGPKRISAVGWGLLTLLPLFIWYSHVSLTMQMVQEIRERTPTISCYMLSNEAIAAAAIDGLARFQLPHRLEGKRIVMFYDDQIENPEADLAAMDTFIENEESHLGRTMPQKLHWVRTSLVGLYGNAIAGIAISDPEKDFSMMYQETFPYKDLSYIDYHEASHNIISTPTVYSAWHGNAPPMLLVEGYAQARSLSWENLAYECRNLKLNESAMTLKELLSPDYFYRADGRTYQQGGAFVSALLEHFPPEKFRELYFNSSQQTFAQDIERVYGMTLDELDAFYWQKIDDLYSYAKATESLNPEEKALLEEFREAYNHQRKVSQTLFADCTIESTARYSYEFIGEEPEKSTSDTFATFQSKGEFFRHEEKTKFDSDDEISERSSISLKTPTLLYYAFQTPRAKENPPRKEASCYQVSGDLNHRHLILSCLQDRLPYTIFDYGSSSLDDFLWSPQNGLTLESVVAENDFVTITIKSKENLKLQLRLEPKRHWALVEATKTNASEETKRSSHDTEIREFEGEIDGVPILKKRTSKRETIGEKGTSRSTTTVEITRLDNTPAPDSAFAVDTIAELKDVKAPTNRHTLPIAQRLHRHFTFIAIWLLLAFGMIANGWFRDKKMNSAHDEQVQVPC